MKIRKIYVIIALLLSSASVMKAQEQAFSFTTLDMSAAGAGMAGATKSVVGDIAWASNPATISLSEQKFSVGFAYGMWMPKVDSQNRITGSVAGRFGRFGAKVSFYDNLYSAYPIVGSNGQASGTFSPSDLKLGLGLGFKATDWLSVGAEVEYLRSSLAAGHSYGGVAASVLATYARKGLNLTVGVEDIGTGVSGASGTRYSLPSSVLVSGAYGSRFSSHGIKADVDLNYFFSNGLACAVGAEYDYDGMVFARAGYRFATEGSPYAGFGGVGLGVKFWGIRLDASMIFASRTLANSVLISLGYSF